MKFDSSGFLKNLCFQVVILNSTSVLLEVRFDIPFGVAPKVFLATFNWLLVIS